MLNMVGSEVREKGKLDSSGTIGIHKDVGLTVDGIKQRTIDLKIIEDSKTQILTIDWELVDILWIFIKDYGELKGVLSELLPKVLIFNIDVNILEGIGKLVDEEVKSGNTAKVSESIKRPYKIEDDIGFAQTSIAGRLSERFKLIKIIRELGGNLDNTIINDILKEHAINYGLRYEFLLAIWEEITRESEKI